MEIDEVLALAAKNAEFKIYQPQGLIRGVYRDTKTVDPVCPLEAACHGSRGSYSACAKNLGVNRSDFWQILGAADCNSLLSDSERKTRTKMLAVFGLTELPFKVEEI